MSDIHPNDAETLYLVQHGAAKPKTEDPERPLTEAGRATIVRVADWAAAVGLAVSQIRHSSKPRARQTAEIFADKLQPRHGLLEVPGMNPKGDVQPIIDSLADCPRPTMFVGHLPFLSRMAAMLIVGNPEQELIHFQYGAIVGLVREEDGWQLATLIPPDVC